MKKEAPLLVRGVIHSIMDTLTTREVTALRGWSRTRISAFVTEGRLTPRREGNRNVFDRAQVEALVVAPSGRPLGSKGIKARMADNK